MTHKHISNGNTNLQMLVFFSGTRINLLTFPGTNVVYTTNLEQYELHHLFFFA